MVRKWSYLTDMQISDSVSIHSLTSTKHFKVFRATTRFKKYTRGMTFNVRKRYNRRKLLTNNIFLGYITVDWLRFYLKSRHRERYIQSYGTVNATARSAEFDAFKVRALKAETSLGVALFSGSKSVLNGCIRSERLLKSILVPDVLGNSRITYTQSLSPAESALSEYTHPALLTYDKLTYAPNTTLALVEHQLTVFKSVTAALLVPSLHMTVSIRQILILLVLKSSRPSVFSWYYPSNPFQPSSM